MLRRSHIVSVLFLFVASIGTAAQAQINPIILARTGTTSYNLPNGSSLSSSTVAINDARQVAMRINTVGGTFNGSNFAPGVFLGSFATGSGTGGIVHLGPHGNIISDASLNAGGAVAYFDLDLNRPVSWDPVNGSRNLNMPLGATNIGGLTIRDDGALGGRIQFGSTGRIGGTFPQQTSGTPPTTTYYVDNGIDASSPYSFLFVPGVAQASNHFATKVQRTSGAGGGDQILRFASDGSSNLIASTAAAQPGSPFSTLSNGVSISSDGTKVAFQARLTGTTTDAVYLWDSTTEALSQVAVAGMSGINTIDAFAPDVNDSGQVVFRGADSSNRSSVFLFDGNQVIRVAGVGDQVMTDVGLRQLGRRDGQASQSGAPRINNLGDIAFAFQYFDPSNPNSIADGTLIMARAIPEPSGALLIAAVAGTLLLRRRRSS